MKKTTIVFGLLFIFLVSCQSFQRFPGTFGEYRTLGYGAIYLDDKDITITGLDVRPVIGGVGLAFPIHMVGPNEFTIDNWKPGKYYVDTIHFQVPGVLFKTEASLRPPIDSTIVFDLKPGRVTSIGSYVIHVKPVFGSFQMDISSNNLRLDNKVLSDIIQLAADSQWKQILIDFSNARNSQKGSTDKSGA